MEAHPGNFWLRGCVLKSQWNPREKHFLISVFCDDVAQNSQFVSEEDIPFGYYLFIIIFCFVVFTCKNFNFYFYLLFISFILKVKPYI